MDNPSDNSDSSVNDFNGFKRKKIDIIAWRHHRLFSKNKKSTKSTSQQAQTPGLDILSLTRLKIQSEISAYNQMDLLDRDGNPLEWWKKMVYFSHV